MDYDDSSDYGRGSGTGSGHDTTDPFPHRAEDPRGGRVRVGKTTFVGAVSEIAPLSTEELLTTVSAATDNLDGIENKLETTWPWTSAASPRPGNTCCTCSGHPARNASVHVGRTVRGRPRRRDHRRHPPAGRVLRRRRLLRGARPRLHRRDQRVRRRPPLRPRGGARRDGPAPGDPHRALRRADLQFRGADAAHPRTPLIDHTPAPTTGTAPEPAHELRPATPGRTPAAHPRGPGGPGPGATAAPARPGGAPDPALDTFAAHLAHLAEAPYAMVNFSWRAGSSSRDCGCRGPAGDARGRHQPRVRPRPARDHGFCPTWWSGARRWSWRTCATTRASPATPWSTRSASAPTSAPRSSTARARCWARSPRPTCGPALGDGGSGHDQVDGGGSGAAHRTQRRGRAATVNRRPGGPRGRPA